MALTTRVDIFFDTVCPWCYLGKRRFELALEARPQYEPLITWRPFELNPDLPWDGVERAAHLAASIGDPAQIEEIHAGLVESGRAVGLAFEFERIARLPHTRRSHLLIAHAARRGVQGEVVERVMQAYFEEGRDVGDVEELVRLGVEAGLEERDTRAAVVLRAGQDGIVAAQRHAAVIGIKGVPTFLFDRQYTLAGAQDVETFIEIIDRVVELAAAREVS
jgi:predicted DsbA family dithiol-disulfide isomerase